MLLYLDFVSKLSDLPLNILYRLNFKTGHINCHISLPFEIPKCLSSSLNHMLQLWKGAPCFLVLYYYCTPLQPLSSVLTNTDYLLLSEAVSNFILVNRMARCLDMGLPL